MSARRTVILCEGPQDLEALRELLRHAHGMTISKTPRAPGAGGDRQTGLLSANGDVEVVLLVGGGRPGLHSKWVRFVRDMSPSESCSRIGVSFDPNGDSEADWRRAVFEDAWGQPLIQRDAAGDYHIPTAVLSQGQLLPVMPLPWVSNSAQAYGLPDHHSLDRILTAVARQVHATLDGCVHAFLQCASKNGENPGWKEAAKSWEALLYPKGGFAAQVFGQDQALWTVAQPILQGTPMWQALGRLLT